MAAGDDPENPDDDGEAHDAECQTSDGTAATLLQALQEKQYGKIYILLGIFRSRLVIKESKMGEVWQVSHVSVIFNIKT